MLIAQITDTHIVPREENSPLTATNDRRLECVIEVLNALSPRPEAVLLTGDAVDRGNIKSYTYLKELLAPLSMPLYLIPGNHDERAAMREAFSDLLYLPRKGKLDYVVETHPVRLVGLDTLVSGQDYGELSTSQLEWLREVLAASPTEPTLIFMHHFPIHVGQACFDVQPLRLGGDLEGLIASSPQVIGCVAGHYHKAVSTLYVGKPFVIAPSVAPSHYIARAQDRAIAALDLVCPSFVLHRWERGKPLLSQFFQVVEPQNRIPKVPKS